MFARAPKPSSLAAKTRAEGTSANRRCSPKTRAGDFLRKCPNRVGKNEPQAANARRVARPATTKSASGVRYYGRRYYDPKDGRFVGRDPIAEKGGLNLYAFVANNVVNGWDYLGMNAEIPLIGTTPDFVDHVFGSGYSASPNLELPGLYNPSFLSFVEGNSGFIGFTFGPSSYNNVRSAIENGWGNTDPLGVPYGLYYYRGFAFPASAWNLQYNSLRNSVDAFWNGLLDSIQGNDTPTLAPPDDFVGPLPPSSTSTPQPQVPSNQRFNDSFLAHYYSPNNWMYGKLSWDGYGPTFSLNDKGLIDAFVSSDATQEAIGLFVEDTISAVSLSSKPGFYSGVFDDPRGSNKYQRINFYKKLKIF